MLKAGGGHGQGQTNIVMGQKKNTVKKLRHTVNELKRSLLFLQSQLNTVKSKVNDNQVVITKHDSKLKEVISSVEFVKRHLGVEDDSEETAPEIEIIESVEEMKNQREESHSSCETSKDQDMTMEENSVDSDSISVQSVRNDSLSNQQQQPSEHLAEILRNQTTGPFKCNQCPRELPYRRHLVQHLQAHERKNKKTPPNPLKCDQCDKQFSHKARLTLHKMTHGSERPFECHVCDMRFKRKDHLQNHLQTHFSSRPYICPVCNKSFTREATLTEHLNAHKETRVHPVHTCEICGQEILYKRCIDQHMRQHKKILEEASRKVPSKFHCPECSQTFAAYERLQKHSKIHRIKTSRCTICNIKFSRPYSLVRHQELKHSGKGDLVASSNHTMVKIKSSEKRITAPRKAKAQALVSRIREVHCEICQIDFVREDSLRRHMGKKHPELKVGQEQLSKNARSAHKIQDKPFKCSICYKPFRTSVSLTKHISHLHGYNCRFCKDSFHTWVNLEKHVKTSHKDNFTQRFYQKETASSGSGIKLHFGCLVCKKRMPEELLLGHVMMNHAWDKPYKCKLCDRSFTTVSAQKTHARRHSQRQDEDPDYNDKD